MNLSSLPLLSLLTFADFSNFTFCRENSRGPFESQCVELEAAGQGAFKFKRRNAELIHIPINLSPAAAGQFVRLLAGTNYLENGETYESGKRVADLGLKRLAVEGPMGRRQATFNYSGRREVIELVSFMDKLINQEMIGFEIGVALQFERLGVPKHLDVLANELRAKRIADPQRLIPVLERIESDQRLVNYARVQATKLKKQIEEGKMNP